MSKSSNESSKYYKQKHSSRIPPISKVKSSYTHYSYNNDYNNHHENYDYESSDNSIQITGKGPYNILKQVLKNMTPDTKLSYDNHYNITIGANQVYGGSSSSTSDNFGYRSGGTTSNDIGTTPN